jgi:hypothetical protein
MPVIQYMEHNAQFNTQTEFTFPGADEFITILSCREGNQDKLNADCKENFLTHHL